VSDLQSLIDSFWDFSNPSLSESRFREAADRVPESNTRLELLTQIARAQGLQRRIEEAHATLDAVERNLLPHEAEPSFDDARTRLHLERGRIFNSVNRRDKALPLFDRAFMVARDSGNDHLAIDAAHMIAIVHGASNRATEAMTWNRRALDLADSSTQPRARQWCASLHNNIGWTLHDAGDAAAALPHFQRALDCWIELGKAGDIRIARWCIARCLRSLGRINEALGIQRELLNEATAAGSSDGFIHEELAECLLALGRAEEARPHFAHAHGLLSSDENLAESQPARLQRLAQLAGPVLH